jgi:hypothetical protein
VRVSGRNPSLQFESNWLGFSGGRPGGYRCFLTEEDRVLSQWLQVVELDMQKDFSEYFPWQSSVQKMIRLSHLLSVVEAMRYLLPKY